MLKDFAVSTPADATQAKALHLLRCQVDEWEGAARSGFLGGLCYGLQAVDASTGWAAVEAALLSATPWRDVWQAAPSAVASGRRGGLFWRHTGEWLFGMLRVDEPVGNNVNLEARARAAYDEVFSLLRQQGDWHLLRVWNYLPRINAEEGGLERYRQFNIGRQQAFQDHRRDNLAGSPAACAIGTRGGPLCIYFLAGPHPSMPLENPRQVPAYHYPTEFGPRSPTFSRACLVRSAPGQCLLMISGTASIVGHDTVHAGDVQAQAAETLRNLQAVIDQAHGRCTGRFALEELACTVYLRHAQHAPAVMTVLGAAWGPQAKALTQLVMVEADICRADLLIEIEAHGVACGELL
ncbi:MAG: hypothetical protein V4739_02280 [Pseudomonadota bacterium]